MKNLLYRIIVFLLSYLIICFFLYYLFYPIYQAKSIIFPFAITPFDIAKVYPKIWLFIKNSYFIFFFLAYLIVFNFLYNNMQKYFYISNHKKQISTTIAKNNNEINLLIGKNQTNEDVFINEYGLYQNMLITGTIGTGKTSSAMYPFTKQLISYKPYSFDEKLAMLILDVKGNYYEEVLKYAKEQNRLDDIILIELGGNYKYNPLDKPDLKPIVLANRLKTILSLFSPNNSESYWLDKAEQILAECIKLCRLYNNGYVNFIEIHKLIMFEDYYKEKIENIKNQFISGLLTKEEIYNFSSSIDFFEKEYFCLDDRTLSILKSEISRITSVFVSDYSAMSTFCPKKEDINFKRFLRNFR